MSNFGSKHLFDGGQALDQRQLDAIYAARVHSLSSLKPSNSGDNICNLNVGRFFEGELNVTNIYGKEFCLVRSDLANSGRSSPKHTKGHYREEKQLLC